ncbi:MAG: hypothetical protein KAT28_02720 [Candidatus Aenigmarchaeota archaeon]|nr:hypothetical protein [Candidatus Aenigmarchaeota archaeon]
MRGTILIVLCLISVLFISGCTVNPELERKYFSVIGEGTVEEKEVEIPDVIVIESIKIPALAGGRIKPDREIDIIVTLKNRDVNKPITLTYAGISDSGIFTCINCGDSGEKSISPGQLKTFSFTVKAPSNEGTIALPGHLEFSVKYKYTSTRLATITFIGKDDYMDYLESGGKVSISIINIPSDGPVELDLDISNIHQPVVIEDRVISSKLQSNGKNSELMNEIADSFFGKVVFAADCSVGDTGWGEASSYGCIGNDKRCFGGNCIECDGKMVNGLCWYESEYSKNQNCNEVCYTRNGVYNGNCEWVDENCIVCKEFHPGARCSGVGEKEAPYYNPITNYCLSNNGIYDCNAKVTLSTSTGVDSARICACNGDNIVDYDDSSGSSDDSSGSGSSDDSSGSGGSGSSGSSSSSSYEDKGEHQIYLEVLNKGSGEIDIIETGNLDISFEDMGLEVCSEEFGGKSCGGTTTFNNESIVVRGSNPFRYYFSFTPNTDIIGGNSITATKKVEVSAEYIYRLPQTIDILVSPRAEI